MISCHDMMVSCHEMMISCHEMTIREFCSTTVPHGLKSKNPKAFMKRFRIPLCVDVGLSAPSLTEERACGAYDTQSYSDAFIDGQSSAHKLAYAISSPADV